jgi:hypothetical protein
VWVAGPAAGGIMADWGAEVIKVEPPAGDPQRRVFGALGVADQAGLPPFEIDNRGKRSVVLDLTADTGRESMDRLVERADVFITNLRPDALERLGLDHSALLERFPRASGADGDAEVAGVGSFSSSLKIKQNNKNHNNNNENHENKVASPVTTKDEVTRMGASSERKASGEASQVVDSSQSESESQVDDESNWTVTTAEEMDDARNPSTMFPVQMQGFLVSLVALVVVGFVLLRVVSHFVAQQRSKCREPSETDALLDGSSEYKGQYGTNDPS